MAVEIPVYVDIEGAFKDAAKRTPNASKPLEEQVELISKRLSNAIQKMQKVTAKPVGGANVADLDAKMSRYANTARLAAQQMLKLGQAQGKLVAGRVDIQELSSKISVLAAKWNSMKLGSKFDGDGKLRVKAQDLIGQMNTLTGRAIRFGNALSESTKKSAEGLDLANSALGRMLKNALRLFAIHTAGTFLRNVREVTAEFELQRVALGSIIQDTEKAETLFRRIKAAAIESPFEIKDLVSYTKQLSAYQIETDKLFDTTMKLADVSAGLGVDMGRLILAYGQVRAASVLRGQELRQFTEAGIPLVDELAKKFTALRGEMVSTGEVFQLISERAVPFRMIEEIFNDMTSAGGMFYKMQEKQAKTLAGQWANLKDSISIMYDEIGNTKTVHGAMESLIADARWLMQHWRGVADALSVVGTTLISYVSLTKGAELWTRLTAKAALMAKTAESSREAGLKKLITSIVGQTAADKISATATNMHTAATAKAAVATSTLAKTFWNLTAAMLSNPFGIIAVAVAGIVALFSKLGKQTQDVSKSIDNAAASIAEFNKTTKEVSGLIDQYEELSKKEKLTADESKKLRGISRELGNVFPKTTEGINEQTGALTLNIEKLKEYNKEAEEALRKGMQSQINVNKKTIEDNQKEIERLTRETNRGWGRNKALGLFSPILFPLSDKRMAENKDAIVKLTDENRELAKSNQDLEDTLNGVNKEAEKVASTTTGWQDKLIKFNRRVDKNGNAIITIDPDQVRNYATLDSALEDIAKKYKEYAEQEKLLASAIEGKSGKEREELEGIKARTTARKELAKEELDYYNAFYLTEKKGGKGSSSDRLKRLKEEISDLENAHKKFVELSQYVSKSKALSDISTFFPSLKGWEPTYENMISQLEAMLTQYKGDADATRIIEQAIANIKFDKVKSDLEDALKKISEDIKHSEEAQNFYQDILGLTGDKDLATSMSISVYGDVGEEFKDRIKKQLVDSLSSLDAETFSGLDDAIRDAFDSGDYEYLMKNLDKVPEKLHNVVKSVANDAERYNVGVINNYAKLLNKFDELEQQRINIENQADQEIRQLREGLALEIKGINENAEIEDKESAKKAAEARVSAVEDGINRERKLQLSRLTRDYRMFFSSVGVISDQAARKVAKAQKEMLTEQFLAGQKTLAQYNRELNEIDKQLDKYSKNKGLFASYLSGGIDEAVSKMGEFSTSLLAIADASTNRKDGSWIVNADDKEYIDKLGMMFGGKIFGVSGRKDVFSKLMEKTEGNADKMAEALANASDSIKEMGSNMSASVMWADLWVKNIGSAIRLMDELGNSGEETAKWWDEVASRIFTLGTVGSAENNPLGIGIKGAGDRLSYLNEYALSGFEKFKSGDFVGAIVDNIKGWYGVFGPNIKRTDKQIKEQSRLLDDLEYSYDRLDVAMEKSFGSEYIYNYNKQLEVLQAKAEAYRKQAELEESKEKAADSDKIREYKNHARDVENQIDDMRTKLSEFFAGTDLTSAAEDFANAWIEAYKEFGSTTDAMSEKFNDMIQNMITRSLAAKIMQEMLQPIFRQIDTMSKDGLLATDDIAAIAALAQERIPLINDAMTNLMTSLASAGLDVRASTAGFHGISKDIAGASEESILGLAAAINTQNFYISYVPTISENVSQILAAMTGGVSPTAPVETTETGEVLPSVQRMVYDHLPNMDANLAEVLRLVRSVITTKNGTTNTNYVAIK